MVVQDPCERIELKFSRRFTPLLAKERFSVFSGSYHLVVFLLQEGRKIVIFLSRNSSLITKCSLCCYLIAHQEAFLYNTLYFIALFVVAGILVLSSG